MMAYAVAASTVHLVRSGDTARVPWYLVRAGSTTTIEAHREQCTLCTWCKLLTAVRNLLDLQHASTIVCDSRT